MGYIHLNHYKKLDFYDFYIETNINLFSKFKKLKENNNIAVKGELPDADRFQEPCVGHDS